MEKTEKNGKRKSAQARMLELHDVADGYKQRRTLNKFYRKVRRERKENILNRCFNKYLKLDCPPRRIYDSKAKDAKRTIKLFSFIKVCFYYTILKHSSHKR